MPEWASMEPFDRLALVLTDSLFTCYSRYIAKLLSKDSPTFLSTFMHAPSSHADAHNAAIDSKCESGATCHAADLNWIFPWSENMHKIMNDTSFTPEEVALTRTYSSAVRSFAAGDPSAVWLPY